MFVNDQNRRVLNIKRSFKHALLELGITKKLFHVFLEAHATPPDHHDKARHSIEDTCGIFRAHRCEDG